MYYSLIALIVSIVVGTVVSLITGESRQVSSIAGEFYPVLPHQVVARAANSILSRNR